MVRLIDCTYFTKGERLIQNAPIDPARCTDQNEIAVRESINGWIDSEQENFLNAMIGGIMAKILLAYLEAKAEAEAEAAEPTLGDPAETEEVEEDEELEFLADSLKESLADYVLYKMLRGTTVHMVNTGAVVLKSSNEHENTARRQASVWNAMVERNKRFLKDAANNLETYTICYEKSMVTPITALNL